MSLIFTHLHPKLLERVHEHLDLLLWHLVWLEGGSKGDQDHPVGGRVHELLQVGGERTSCLQVEPSNLGKTLEGVEKITDF